MVAGGGGSSLGRLRTVEKRVRAMEGGVTV